MLIASGRNKFSAPEKRRARGRGTMLRDMTSKGEELGAQAMPYVNHKKSNAGKSTAGGGSGRVRPRRPPGQCAGGDIAVPAQVAIQKTKQTAK